MIAVGEKWYYPSTVYKSSETISHLQNLEEVAGLQERRLSAY